MGEIQSAGVKKNGALVDENGNFHTFSITETEEARETDDGNAYNINTGDITITDAVKVTLLYLKNTGTKDIFITSVIYLTGNSTNGTAATDFLYTAILNPTAGDIITNTNNVATNANRRAGSPNTLTANAYVGAVGETAQSGGTNLFGTRLASSGRTVVPIGIAIPKNQSIAIDFTAKTSNSNCIVQLAFSCYEIQSAS